MIRIIFLASVFAFAGCASKPPAKSPDQAQPENTKAVDGDNPGAPPPDDGINDSEGGDGAQPKGGDDGGERHGDMEEEDQ